MSKYSWQSGCTKCDFATRQFNTPEDDDLALVEHIRANHQHNTNATMTVHLTVESDHKGVGIANIWEVSVDKDTWTLIVAIIAKSKGWCTSGN